MPYRVAAKKPSALPIVDDVETTIRKAVEGLVRHCGVSPSVRISEKDYVRLTYELGSRNRFECGPPGEYIVLYAFGQRVRVYRDDLVPDGYVALS